MDAAAALYKIDFRSGMTMTMRTPCCCWATLVALVLRGLGATAAVGLGSDGATPSGELAPPPQPAAASKATWKQQRFAITFLEQEFAPATALPAYYRSIASLNFTVAEGWGEGRPISVVNANLNAAATAGLNSIVSGYSPTGSQPNPVALTNSTNPHLLGFLVKDEPKASDFALLKNWTAELAITHPGKLRFINLLPNCSAMGTPVMSNASYTEYVHRFAQEVQPDLLAFDMYPEFKKQASLVAYRRTLALFRSLALAHRIPVRRFSSYSHFLW
eukprot:COSAG05_NODE_4601_length_1442_cov_9.492926_1_plen_274_part_00